MWPKNKNKTTLLSKRKFSSKIFTRLFFASEWIKVLTHTIKNNQGSESPTVMVASFCCRVGKPLNLLRRTTNLFRKGPPHQVWGIAGGLGLSTKICGLTCIVGLSMLTMKIPCTSQNIAPQISPFLNRGKGTLGRVMHIVSANLPAGYRPAKLTK